MRIFFCLLVGALAACTRQAPPDSPVSPPSQPVAQSAFIPTPAQLERFRAEGPEPTLRKIAVADYWLHYKVMQATGMEQALGGEPQAVSALKALGEAYERRLRGASEDVPRMIRTDFTGEGMASGLTGMSMGMFMSMVTGGLVSGISDAQIADLTKAGPIRQSNDHGSFEIRFGEDGSVTQSSEFEVNENGINGKVRMKTRMDACPDESGKVSIDIDVDSQMTVNTRDGTGGHVKSEMKYERWVDDDAKLIDTGDGSASNLHVRMGGIENFQGQSFDITVGHERGGNRIFESHGDQGFSIFRPEESQRASKLLESVESMQGLMAEMMLRGMAADPPWERGRCIDLEVTSTPGKRSGLAPGSTFDLEATPRAKNDGKPAGGTVTATLTGGAQLQPASGKVRADARYRYTGPGQKNEKASIAFESRSRRGVGRATVDFDTQASSPYRIEGGADEFHGSGIACDLAEQFFIEGKGNTVRFEPSSAEGGRYSYSGTMSGFRVYGHGTYRVDYRDDVAVSIRATGPGSVVTPIGTQTREGTEDYTLTRVESAECAE
ncbi:MAG TPA: hypothetical protein VFZ95_11555 [Steroidobacteraceae bacterium]